MNYQTVEFANANGVATLVLNRPQSLNSFTAEMHAEIRDALGRIEGDTAVRCLLISGRGRAFCAGQFLTEHDVAQREQPPDLGEPLERNYNPLIRKLRSLRLPVVCAVNGVAAGAGANLALACDIVLAARSASFIQAFCKLGLVPDTGGSWHLPRLVGHARAMALAMLGERITAEQAEQWGMIWKCVDDAQLMEQADTLARHLATQPTQGLVLIKRALNATWHNSLDAQLDLERDLQREAGCTDDYREGIAAFMAKREPRFLGR
ncbi:MAG: 2-(1,2-epoxy-1,2-dihydrophenyl)acetyl-CoA isomerase PaaG [Nitrococcus sp.]|nr:2-(1,2-epoxy-1,2-dihydrophenyl)acetyl-CoA isomerase PaaG [Nitrococcus sp.]